MKNRDSMMKGNFKKAIIVCILAGAMVIGLGVAMISMIQSSLGDIVEYDMEKETNEYKKRILGQIEKDFEALETLAVVLSYADVMDDEWFEACLYEANSKNNFLSMSYFDAGGKWTVVYEDYGMSTGVSYTVLDPEVVKVIELALGGENAMSKFFDSIVVNERIFAYAVPVYDINGGVKGVLAAGATMDIFDDIIGKGTHLEGGKAVHLVNSDGKILISTLVSNYSLLPPNIFRSDYFTEQRSQDIEAAIAEDRAIASEMTMNGKKYSVYLNPVGVNQWYVMYVNSNQEINQAAYYMVNIMGGVFVLLVIVVIYLLIYICRSIIRNNNNLRHLAFNDTLTGALNMAGFWLALDSVKREKRAFTIVGINIRQFKFINEIFGVPKADEFLKGMKAIIDAEMRKDEFFCREHGDMFYLCLFEDNKRIIGERVRRVMHNKKNLSISGNDDYDVLVYAGAYIKYEDDKEIVSNEVMISRTRFALNHYKNVSALDIFYYDEEVYKKEEIGNFVETHMEQALERGEFKLYLQPKILLSESRVGSAEALVRWITDDGQMIMPDSFIPLFEKNGFCVKLDKYMVDLACKKIREWFDVGIKPVSIAVNQSRLLFFESDYVEYLKSEVKKYDIPPSLITLEIIEGLALEHADEINEKLRELRKFGFKISMDDFGSGYSSFNTLGNLEIDELKLDRSFLMEATSDNSERFVQIMEHIVSMTKALGIKTVAEGVETEENHVLIDMLGCDYGQGYLYSPPVPVTEFERKFMVLSDKTNNND